MNPDSNTPKIGITLTFPSDEGCLFNNGLRQNALFFYKLLFNIGKYDVYFIVDKNSSEGEKYLYKMNYKCIKQECIIDACFNIVVTFGFFLPTNICALLKESGIKQIFYNCGNFFIMDSESCLFSTEEAFYSMYNRCQYYDECWNIPQMENTNHFYFKTLLRCDKVIEVPFIWSPELIDFEKNKYVKRTESKSIAICEPNISIMKWCFPPILICENAYRDITITNKINKVFITNIVDTSNKTFNLQNFNKLVSCLDLKKDSKLSIEKRYVSLSFMANYADIVVSHTWENYMNNLYFDIAWMGWPIIHNGKFCKEVGYYYDEFNYEMGGNVLKDAILNHDNNVDEYLIKNRKYMQKYLPSNIELQKKYDDLIIDCLVCS